MAAAAPFEMTFQAPWLQEVSVPHGISLGPWADRNGYRQCELCHRQIASRLLSLDTNMRGCIMVVRLIYMVLAFITVGLSALAAEWPTASRFPVRRSNKAGIIVRLAREVLGRLEGPAALAR